MIKAIPDAKDCPPEFKDSFSLCLRAAKLDWITHNLSRKEMKDQAAATQRAANLLFNRLRETHWSVPTEHDIVEQLDPFNLNSSSPLLNVAQILQLIETTARRVQMPEFLNTVEGRRSEANQLRIVAVDLFPVLWTETYWNSPDMMPPSDRTNTKFGRCLRYFVFKASETRMRTRKDRENGENDAQMSRPNFQKRYLTPSYEHLDNIFPKMKLS